MLQNKNKKINVENWLVKSNHFGGLWKSEQVVKWRKLSCLEHYFRPKLDQNSVRTVIQMNIGEFVKSERRLENCIYKPHQNCQRYF